MSLHSVSARLQVTKGRRAQRSTSTLSEKPAGVPWKRLSLLLVALLLTALAGFAYAMIEKRNEVLAATWQLPYALLALAVVPWVLWRTTFGEDRRVPRLRLGTTAALASGPRGPRVWLRDIPGVFRSVGLVLLIVAIARPVNSVVPTSAEDEGIDAVLVLDLSGSMRAVIENFPENLEHLAERRSRGVRPTRLDAAKAVIRDFISRRKSDRIGVVVFGKAAYILSPPTLDYHLLDNLVSRMQLDLIDNSATAIGDAVGTAVARLRRSHAKSKAIILLTDGDNNAGSIDPEYAAHLANVIGAKVFTIQIGDGEFAEIQDGFDLFGQPRYVRTQSPVNPELLKSIAEKTGGEMYIATDAESLQASFHDVLDKLEKTKFEANVATYEDLYRLFLLPGMLLIAAEALLRALVLRRFP